MTTCSHPRLCDDDDDGIFDIVSEPPGLGISVLKTFKCLLGENEFEALDDDGVDGTWSEPPGLGSIPDESIVTKAWSEPPGLGLIPSEPVNSWRS